MRLKSFVLTLASLTVAGCAHAAPPAGTAPAPAAETAAERGRAFAEHTCARCHGIGPGEDSRNAGAPRFVVIAGRYNEVSLEHRLGEISQAGHYEMPPQQLGSEQIRDLTAYIQGLDRP